MRWHGIGTALEFAGPPHQRLKPSRRSHYGSAVIHAVRTSGEKFISSLHCVAKKEKSKRVPELGGTELTDLTPDVLMAGPF